MNKVFIIHGAYGHPKGNWFPWLSAELKKSGCKVIVPKFPTPKNQTLSNWLKVFEVYEKDMNKKCILVGHSLGSAFILSSLERIRNPVKAVFLVSEFTKLLGNPAFDKINETFVRKKFQWRKIRSNCKKFYVINSDNDPYVPIGLGKLLAENLGAKLMVLKNAGHINAEAGYTRFGLLLGLIKKELAR